MTATTKQSVSDEPEESICDESEQFVLKKVRGTLNDVWNHKNPSVDLITKMTPTRPAFERIPDEGCILPEVHFSPFQGIPADNYVKTVISIESSDEDEDFVTWRNRTCGAIDDRNNNTINATINYLDGTIDKGNIPGSSNNNNRSSSNSCIEISGGIKKTCDSPDGGQMPIFSSHTPDNVKTISRREYSSDNLCKTVHKNINEHSVEKLTVTSKSLVCTQNNASKTADTYYVTNTNLTKMLIAKGKKQGIQIPGKDTQTHLSHHSKTASTNVTPCRYSQAPGCPKTSKSSERKTPVNSNRSCCTSSSGTAFSNGLSICSTPVITTQSNSKTTRTSQSSPKPCITPTKIRSKVVVSDIERLTKGMGAVKQLKKQQKVKRSKEIAKKQKEPPPISISKKEKAKGSNVSTTKEVEDIVSKLLGSQKKVKYTRKENNQEGVEFIIPKKKPALRSTAIQMIRDSYDEDDVLFH